MRVARSSFLVPFLAGIVAAAPAPAGAEDPPADAAAAEGPAPSPWQFRLNALEEYRFRYATGATVHDPIAGEGTPDVRLPAEDDHEFRLSVDAGASNDAIGVSVDLALSLLADLDGVPRAGAPSALASMYTSTASPVWFDLYTLSAAYRMPGDRFSVRAGRQVTDFGTPSVFDGVALRGRVLGRMLEIAAFGGRTVHFFETGDGHFEDWLGSVALVIRPIDDLRLDLDYRFLQETTVARHDVRNHAYGLKIRWKHQDWLFLTGELRGIDAAVSRAAVRLGFRWDALDLGLDVRADVQPTRLGEVAEAEDPFTAILGESLRHARGLVDLWKGFATRGGWYAFHVGWAGRMLLGEDETPFNRDHSRVFLRLEGRDIGTPGLSAAVVGEYHYGIAGAQDERDRLLAFGGHVAYERKGWRGEVGTSWDRWKYRFYRDALEMDQVRTVWADLRGRPLGWLDVRVRYEYERFDRDVHTVRVSLGQGW